MTKTSQLNYVEKEMVTKGLITRNDCLKVRITRLSAIIFDLKELGFNIVGERIYLQDGTWDYRYILISIPKAYAKQYQAIAKSVIVF